MDKQQYSIYSGNLKRDMTVSRYGNSGVSFLGFPTQCASSSNYEEFGVIRTLSRLIDEGKMQVFCVDTVDQESWYCVNGINTWRSARQESYYRFIIDEVLPLIQRECGEETKPLVMGIDMGATHACISFFRRPELFSGLLALSGIYDSSYYYHGWMDSTLYDNSVECFLNNMPEDHPWIKRYNNKLMILCCGMGPWEGECLKSLRNLEKIFHKKRISAAVDIWGKDVSHDWPWWRHQLEYYVPRVIEHFSLFKENDR